MIPNDLKGFCERTHTTERELAEKLGVSIGYVNLLKNGERRPSPELAQKIEEITGIPFRQLLIKDKGNKRKSA